jgi:hypothetical protein
MEGVNRASASEPEEGANMGTHAVSWVVRRVMLSVVALLAVSGLQVLAAAPAAANTCPGGSKNVIVLSDPLDPRQIFDENNNDLICAFKKTFQDDHVHKVRA